MKEYFTHYVFFSKVFLPGFELGFSLNKICNRGKKVANLNLLPYGTIPCCLVGGFRSMKTERSELMLINSGPNREK